MSDVPADEVTVHLYFSVMTPLGIYRDTLVFTEEEWAARDAATITTREQDLANVWVEFRALQIRDEQDLATAAGKLAKIAEYEAQIVDLQAAADALRAA